MSDDTLISPLSTREQLHIAVARFTGKTTDNQTKLLEDARFFPTFVKRQVELQQELVDEIQRIYAQPN